MDKFIEYSDDKATLQECFEVVFDLAEQFKAPTIGIVAYEHYSNLFDMTEETKAELRYKVVVSGNVDE